MHTKDKVIELVEPVLADQGLELVDVGLHAEGRGQVLRLLVDREGGVDLDSLSRLSRDLSTHLDVHEPISGHYTLEVSSPGINRPLRKPAHFVRYLGERIRVRTVEPIDGQRNFLGRLALVTAGAIAVADDQGKEVTIPFPEIEKANYEHQFSAADFAREARGGHGIHGAPGDEPSRASREKG